MAFHYRPDRGGNPSLSKVAAIKAAVLLAQPDKRLLKAYLEIRGARINGISRSRRSSSRAAKCHALALASSGPSGNVGYTQPESGSSFLLPLSEPLNGHSHRVQELLSPMILDLNFEQVVGQMVFTDPLSIVARRLRRKPEQTHRGEHFLTDEWRHGVNADLQHVWWPLALNLAPKREFRHNEMP